jgi:Flp pilus assembly protein TadG
MIMQDESNRGRVPAKLLATWRRRIPFGEQGGTLIEFGLSFVLFFSILFGIVDFGRALYAYDAISDAARTGTRYAIVHGSSSTSPATAATISSYVTTNCCAGLSSTAITVNTTWNPNNSPGSTVNVQVQYTFKFILPFLPSTSVPMSASSQMVISQ